MALLLILYSISFVTAVALPWWVWLLAWTAAALSFCVGAVSGALK